MAGAFNEKLSSKQTAFNNAGALTVAMVGAGLIGSVEEAKAVMKDFADTFYSELSELASADAPVRSAAPQRGFQGGGYGGQQNAPQSPSDPGDYVFNGGKHAGKSISQVADESADYLDWYADNVNKGEAVEYVKRYLNSTRAGI